MPNFEITQKPKLSYYERDEILGSSKNHFEPSVQNVPAETLQLCRYCFTPKGATHNPHCSKAGLTAEIVKPEIPEPEIPEAARQFSRESLEMLRFFCVLALVGTLVILVVMQLAPKPIQPSPTVKIGGINKKGK